MPNPSLGELFTQTWQKIDQMKLHVCLSGEYNVTTLVPTVDYPEENTFYLVPDGTGNNVYTEWIYVNNNWERFGQASIDLSDYVQKTDYASSSTAGVIKIGTTNTGLYLNPTSGTLFTSPASTDELKAGTNTNKPVAPAHEHDAAFYGLAKAAGDTTQSISNNAVGLYTDNAKASIQKMIGTYEAPWELIRDDTFTNDTMAEHIISVDDNNNTFELTDCYLWMIVPATDQTGDYGIGNYGRIRFLTDNANIYYDVLVSEASNPATSKACGSWLTQEHGAIYLECTNLTDVGNNSPVRRFGTNNYDSQLAPFIIPSNYPRIITSVKIAAAQGTIKYRLYGRRKWQT